MKNLISLLILTTLPLINADFIPYGFQSGHFTNPTDSSITDAESINDDSFAGGMYYDVQRSLLYFTGITYGRYFDGSEGGDGTSPHLANSDCILGVLKLPREEAPNLREDPNWLIHNGGSGEGGAKLIYARRCVTLFEAVCSYFCNVMCMFVAGCSTRSTISYSHSINRKHLFQSYHFHSN